MRKFKKTVGIGIAVFAAVMGIGNMHGCSSAAAASVSGAAAEWVDVAGAEADEEVTLKFMDERYNKGTVKRYYPEDTSIPVGPVVYTKGDEVINVFKDPEFTLVSSNPEVATIRLRDTVIFRGVGTTTISATYNGLTASFTLNLVDKSTETPGTITVNSQDYFLLTKGETRKIKYSTENITSKVKIKNSNKKVISLSKSGKIKAKKAGTAVITLSATGGDGNVTKTKITVKVRKGKYLASVSKKAIEKQSRWKTNCTDPGDEQRFMFTKKFFNLLNSIGDQYAAGEYTKKEARKAFSNCTFTYPTGTPKNKASREKIYYHGVMSGKDDLQLVKFTLKGKASVEKIYNVLEKERMWSDYYVYTKCYYNAEKNMTEITCIQTSVY